MLDVKDAGSKMPFAQSHSAPTDAEILDAWIEALSLELGTLDARKDQVRVSQLTAQIADLVERSAQFKAD